MTMLARWLLFIKRCSTPPTKKDQTQSKVKTLHGIGVHKTETWSMTTLKPLQLGMKKSFTTTLLPEERLLKENKSAISLQWYGTIQQSLVADGLVNTTLQRMQIINISLQMVGMWYAAMHHQEIGVDNILIMSNVQ